VAEDWTARGKKSWLLHLLPEIGGWHCLRVASANMGVILAGVPFAKEKESWGLVDCFFFPAHKSKQRYRMLDG